MNSIIPQSPYKYPLSDIFLIGKSILSRKLTHYSGYHIHALENEFAEFEHIPYAVATNSGTSALLLAVRALGIKPGDEIIIPGYTFIAVAQAVLSVGGIPIFADIDDTFTISPASIKRMISKRTKAVIAVHMFGNVADVFKIQDVLRGKRIALIEDCAQAVGATIRGKKVGTVGDFGCFSFNEKKAIGTGQGGIVVTSSKQRHMYMKMCRDTGVDERDNLVKTVGYTLAMTEMEAILARSLLKRLSANNDIRQMRAVQLFKELHDVQDVITPYRIIDRAIPSYSRIAFSFGNTPRQRDDFLHQMKREEIPFRTFYPTPLYRFPLFQSGIEWSMQTPLFTKRHLKAYVALRLPYVEKFCHSQVAMEWSPYIYPQNVSYIASHVHSYIRNLNA